MLRVIILCMYIRGIISLTNGMLHQAIGNPLIIQKQAFPRSMSGKVEKYTSLTRALKFGDGPIDTIQDNPLTGNSISGSNRQVGRITGQTSCTILLFINTVMTLT